jgi:hypothetical protein
MSDDDSDYQASMEVAKDVDVLAVNNGLEEGQLEEEKASLPMCVLCVDLTSSTLSLSPPADYQVLGAVFSGHLGAAVTEIKDATLMSPGAWGRPLALLHPT